MHEENKSHKHELKADKRLIFTLVRIPQRMQKYMATKCLYCYCNNHNYNKIVKSDWLSTALISALIGQFNRTVCVMPK